MISIELGVLEVGKREGLEIGDAGMVDGGYSPS